ncbi:phage Gp37/Gp68 family protein [Actinoplanes subglobosus]|uniref:Phage Gp37/Gp68 family protein n=1 Tax=Actinoplanes subglobosus TaxID=1547892 RepID=A0ABV8IR89_9ACTN
MAEMTGIEWATSTFNPWWGCTRVSRACNGCYAETMAARFGVGWGRTADRRFFGDHHWNEPLTWNRKAAATGQQWRVFCASMADVFEDRDDLAAPRARLWELIAATPALTWMLLTKRPENVAAMTPWPAQEWPAHVWLGVTAEDQKAAAQRIPLLLGTGARTRFLSCEPLSGPLDLSAYLSGPPAAVCTLTRGRGGLADGDLQAVAAFGQYLRRAKGGPGIDWIITGGESGPRAVPSHPDWFRGLRDLALNSGVAFFFKQWGEYLAVLADDDLVAAGRPARRLDERWTAVRVGKKAAGAMLDGLAWQQIPTNLTQPDGRA